MIFDNFWITRWPPQPIFCWLRILTTSDQLKEKLWIYHHQTFNTDIEWHKLGWYWFSAIYEKTRWPPQPIFHKYCLTNYSNAIRAIVSRFYVQVSNHNTSLVFVFWSDQIETKWPPWRNLQILLTQHFNDVRSIKGKVMNISSPNFLYGYKVT